jgi:hypothetical protein
MMNRIINYKNQTRDAITFNTNAFKKFAWLVDELAQVDNDLENKNNAVYLVCS